VAAHPSRDAVIGQCNRAFDMMCERAVSRYTHGSLLSDKQSIQNYVADSYAELQQLRLFTLYTAWLVDSQGTSGARTEIGALKYAGAKVLHDVIDRAVQVHGALGVSTDLPLGACTRRPGSRVSTTAPTRCTAVTVRQARAARLHRPTRVTGPASTSRRGAPRPNSASPHCFAEAQDAGIEVPV